MQLGPCQSRPPFFGKVRRSINRAPSRNDPWWAEHQNTCGGTFIKVKEPEGYCAKGKKNKGTAKQNDTKQGNIKQLLEVKGSGSSSKKMESQSDLEAFTGKGHVLNSRAGRGDEGNTVDLTVEVSMKEKILAAAENRLKTSEQRGRKKRKSPTRREVSKRKEDPSEGSGDIRKLFKRASPDATEIQPLKKTRTVVSDDCQVLDAAAVKDSDRQLHYNHTGTNSSSCSSTSSRVLSGTTSPVSLYDPDMIIVEDDEASLPSSSQGSTGSSVPQRTCPVCLRTDIPETVLSIHVNLCLEEMELSDSDEEFVS